MIFYAYFLMLSGYKSWIDGWKAAPSNLFTLSLACAEAVPKQTVSDVNKMDLIIAVQNWIMIACSSLSSLNYCKKETLSDIQKRCHLSLSDIRQWDFDHPTDNFSLKKKKKKKEI